MGGALVFLGLPDYGVENKGVGERLWDLGRRRDVEMTTFPMERKFQRDGDES